MQEQEIDWVEVREQLQRDGIAGPLTLADCSRLDDVCDEVSKLKAERRAQLQKLRETGESLEGVTNPLIDRHIDVEVIQSLYFDASLQAAVKALFGQDLFIWRTNFFVKSDGTGQNKWHHDRHFEDGFAPLDIYDTNNHFSVTIALTDIDMDRGRLEYVKGSHQPIDGFDRDIPRHFLEVPEVIEDRVTPLPVKRGEFVMFHGSLLHRSLAFGHGDRRMSMAGRIVRNGTAIPTYGAPNPAGGVQAEAEPFVYYSESGILQLN